MEEFGGVNKEEREEEENIIDNSTSTYSFDINNIKDTAQIGDSENDMHFRTHHHDPLPITKPENNIWEQITLKHQLNQLKIQHRYRLEQRWQREIILNESNNEYELDGTNYSGRFRYRLTLTQPLTETYFINVFDELWVKGNKKAIQYDRNWMYVGLGANLSSNYSIQLAYLHQYAQNNPTRYERHHGVQLTGSIKI